MRPISYKCHRFPPDVIRQTVWLYFRFTLSLRDVEEMLAERGIDVGAVSLIATRLRLAHEGRKWPTSGGKRLPLGQGRRATDFVYLTIDEVALLVKMVVKRGMDRDEFLQRLHLSKSQHRPLSSPERQVGVFSPIIEPMAHLPPVQSKRGLKAAGSWRCAA